MSRIKATVRFLHAWRHPDELAREVEAELRFHIEMRARANIEIGMPPEKAQLAAVKSFGDFDRVRLTCCEIKRSFPFNSSLLTIGLHIALPAVAGAAALWAVNVPHNNLDGVLRQLVVIAVMICLFVIVRREKSRERFAPNSASGVFTASERFIKERVPASDIREERSVNIAAYDERGRTPIERVFRSE